MDLKYVLLFFVLLLATDVSASKMLVYGEAWVDGEPLPTGSVVYARVVDSDVGIYALQESGSYGVLVTADLSAGAPIEFYSGDRRAVQVVPYSPDSVMAIDLDFGVVELETTTSTTLYVPPAATGNAVTISISDNVMNFGIVALLFIIVYSIRDLLG